MYLIVHPVNMLDGVVHYSGDIYSPSRMITHQSTLINTLNPCFSD